jgi:hypothetical protein
VTLLKTTLTLEELSKLNLIYHYQDELELIVRGEAKASEVFSKRERNHLRKSGVLLKLRGKSGGSYKLSSDSYEALGAHADIDAREQISGKRFSRVK